MQDFQWLAVFYALLGSSFTFGMTVLGASFVFFIKKTLSDKMTRLSLAFASGIMIAAAVWSLIIPGIEQTKELGQNTSLIAIGGFCAGILFLILIDKITPHMHVNNNQKEGPNSPLENKSLLFLAMTIHNIPEGMAVGVTFASMAHYGIDALPGALVLALGIGIQNIPEGTAISVPMFAQGISKKKAFTYGALSGIVEPIAAVLTALLSFFVIPYMPFLLIFAAGAMLYVVFEELVPEAEVGKHSDLTTIAVLAGFLLMMLLDTTLN